MSEEKALKIGDIIRVSKVFIQDAPFWLPEVTEVRVVDIVTRYDGTKELHLQHPRHNDETTKVP